MSLENRYRKLQWRRLALIVTLPGVLLGTAGFAAAYGSGVFHREVAVACTPKVINAPARGSFDLVVMNATGEPGVASSVGRELKRRGFQVVDTTNAPQDIYVKDAGVISYGNKTLPAALTVQTQLPGARLFFDGRTTNTVSLVVGSGFTKLLDAPGPELPRPGQIVVNVYNATAREGIAKQVAGDLVARGFKQGAVGNDPQKVYLPNDVAVIRYGPEAGLAATLLAEHVAGARLVKVDRAGLTLDVVMGNTWSALVPFGQLPPLPPVTTPTAETIALPCATATS